MEAKRNTSNTPTSDSLLNKQFSEDLKLIDSGFTFFSFISNKSVFIVGSIKDYFSSFENNSKKNKETLKTDSQELTHTIPTKFLQIFSLPESNYGSVVQLQVDNLTGENAFVPIQISCNKFSMAVLLKHTSGVKSLLEKTSEDAIPKITIHKEVNVVLLEIYNVLKNKKISFQSYFLGGVINDLINDNKFNLEALLISSRSVTITESHFKYRVTELINNEKYTPFITKFFEILKNFGIIKFEVVDMIKMYQIYSKVEDTIYNTKILLIGDFVSNWYNKAVDIDKKIWNNIYETSLLFELPYINFPVKQVELGENHLLLLTIDGEILACGDGTSGATGNGIHDFHVNPAKVKFPSNSTIVKKIAAGGRHSLAIDENDKVFSWGCGLNGRLGHGNEKDQLTPKIIDALSSAKINSIDAGDTYSACVGNDGKLYTWGNGEFGRLGHAENKNELFPKFVEYFGIHVKKVQCCYLSTLVYYQNPENKKLETHMVGNKSTIFKPLSEKESDKNEITPSYVEVFKNKPWKRIEFDSKLNKNFTGSIIHAVCGFQFVGVISEEIHTIASIDESISNQTLSVTARADGDTTLNTEDTENLPVKFCNIYLGGNINMTLKGKSDNFEALFPRLVEIFKKINKNNNNDKLKRISASITQLSDLKIKGVDYGTQSEKNKKKLIKKVVCTDNNTFILSEQGDLYIFGSYLNKLASIEVDNYIVPVQVKGTRVISIAVGSNHIIFVSNNYDVFAAGRNSEGQLGQGKPSAIVELQQAAEISKLRNKGVDKVYACENYSIALTFTNEVYAFGDISFLEKSEYIHHQTSPKKIDIGLIVKFACGPNHMLMLVKQKDSLVLNSIGNGTYGKLGNDSENEDNSFEPVFVNIPIPREYTAAEIKKNVIIKCSRYNSACLIKDKSNESNNTLYTWGLCLRNYFTNLKDMGRWTKNHINTREYPLQNTVPVCMPAEVTGFNDAIKTFSVADSMLYTISCGKNELKYLGYFKTNDKIIPLRHTGEFEKISISNDHAAAFNTSKTKLFTWGFNVMNKLGFNLSSLEENVVDYDDKQKYFCETATNVAIFNKIFDSGREVTNVQANQDDNKVNDEKEGETAIPEDNTEETKEDDGAVKETAPKVEDSDNIFYQTQKMIKDDFEKCENMITNNENQFKLSLNKLLIDFNFLIEQQSNLQKIKKNMVNTFIFKMEDPPLNLKIKNTTENRKLPKQYYKYSVNYKCLLSTLKIHPCYIAKIYKAKLFATGDTDQIHQDLYRIIKQLFANIYDDKYSQLVLIIIAKEILKIDIENIKEKFADNKNKNNILDNYEIYEDDKFNLFAKICKLILKCQIKQNFKQEILAMHTISMIYSRAGMKGPENIKSAMLIKYHPKSKIKKKENINELQAHIRKQRIDNILNVVEGVSELLKLPISDFEKKKSSLYSYAPNSNNKTDKGLLFWKLNKISRLLLSEIFGTLEKSLGKSESEKISKWIWEKFPVVFFHKYLKIIENPNTCFTMPTGIVVDKQTYKSFIDDSLNNFYSFANVMRLILKVISMGEGGGESVGQDEISKIIIKSFSINKSKFEIAIKDILMNKNYSKLDFDEFMMKKFFGHSLNDRSYMINFSLYDLKRLQEVIVPNIKQLRILNEDFDFMDYVFFNKKDYPEHYIGTDGGLMAIEVDKEENLKIQLNMKTRLLAFKNPTSLWKCKHCEILTLQDFVLSNEKLFYKEFNLFDKTSVTGKFLQILKNCPVLSKVSGDKISEYLKEELSDSKTKLDKELLFSLITLIVLGDRDKYLIPEQDMADNKIMFDITLKDNANLTNSKLKDLCKKIQNKYEKMMSHCQYQDDVKNTLGFIKKFKERNTEESRYKLFERVRKNFEKGFGNPDIFNNYKNSLKNSCMMILLQKHIENMPRSNLLGKLTKEKKEQLLAFREFELKKLIEDKIIISVIYQDCNADQNPVNFKILLQTTPNAEYLITLSKKITQKSSFWKCGNPKNYNTKKIKSITINNTILSAVSNKSKITFTNEKESYIEIDNFLLVEPKEFIKLLKSLSESALD